MIKLKSSGNAASPELSIIIPTYNESGNIVELIGRIERALPTSWEIIFVDDNSPDGTGELITQIARTDPRVRVLRRVGRRGLATACIEGMASSSADYFAVMDADLQHDENILPKMLESLKNDFTDIAIGSRYIDGGSVGDWNQSRLRISRVATTIAQRLVRCEVADPMSGFFMLRRELFFEALPSLSGQGFKILLDILASAPKRPRPIEIPFQFRARHAGESKLDSIVALEFGVLLADKLVGKWLPIKFLLFAMIGGSGVVVHMGILALLYKTESSTFYVAQAIATGLTMIYNFLLNNQITFRDRRLKGKSFVSGLLLFILTCAIGAITNIQLAKYLYNIGAPWWLAGAAGILVVAVWNFGVTSQIVWRKRP